VPNLGAQSKKGKKTKGVNEIMKYLGTVRCLNQLLRGGKGGRQPMEEKKSKEDEIISQRQKRLGVGG